MTSNDTTTRVYVNLGSELDGKLPLPLATFVSNEQWNAFIDEVNRLNHDAGKLVNRVSFFAAPGLMLVILLVLLMVFDHCMVAWILGSCIVVLITLAISLAWQKKRWFDQLQAVAERTTKLWSPHISVQFKQDNDNHDGTRFLSYFEFVHSGELTTDVEFDANGQAAAQIPTVKAVSLDHFPTEDLESCPCYGNAIMIPIAKATTLCLLPIEPMEEGLTNNNNKIQPLPNERKVLE